MKIINKSNGKRSVSISKLEWEKIGLMFKSAQNLELVKKMDKFDDREISRGIRDAIIAELGAIKQYETLADSISDSSTKKVIQDIADEEKIHVGELQELLKKFDKDDEKFLDEGAKEAIDKK